MPRPRCSLRVAARAVQSLGPHRTAEAAARAEDPAARLKEPPLSLGTRAGGAWAVARPRVTGARASPAGSPWMASPTAGPTAERGRHNLARESPARVEGVAITIRLLDEANLACSAPLQLPSRSACTSGPIAEALQQGKLEKAARPTGAGRPRAGDRGARC